MSQFYNDSIFWIEVDKIDPNPYQPRKEFNQEELESLADSIRQYGILQALVVTRREQQKEDGGIQTRYELIAGERRLRASKLAGIREVPVLIRSGEDSNRMKLELAIIENIQREDLNVVDRALAFQKLVEDFGLSHTEIAKKVGKSRVYVSNSLRVLNLPQEMIDAVSAGKLTEGHTRPLGMLCERPEEQVTLFKEIMFKKLSVRESERIARRIAYDKVRKISQAHDPLIVEAEETLSEKLGTRVQIDRNKQGGRISIAFFSDDDLEILLQRMQNADKEAKHDPNELLYRHMERHGGEVPDDPDESMSAEDSINRELNYREERKKEVIARREEKKGNKETEEVVVEEDDSDELYSITNFTV